MKTKRVSENYGQTNAGRTKLGGVAQAVFTIPATSAASERVFSKAGLIMAPIRSTTSEKTVELLFFEVQLS